MTLISGKNSHSLLISQQLDFPSLFYLPLDPLLPLSHSFFPLVILHRPSFSLFPSVLFTRWICKKGGRKSFPTLDSLWLILSLCPVLFRLSFLLFLSILHLICTDPDSSQLKKYTHSCCFLPFHVCYFFPLGLSRCYTNEAAAQATCPTEDGIREGKFKEFLLIRKYFFLLPSISPGISTFFDWRARSEKEEERKRKREGERNEKRRVWNRKKKEWKGKRRSQKSWF